MGKHLEAGGIEEEVVVKRAYAVVFERAASNYSAYVPDLPGCISTGNTWDEAEAAIREAIAFHVEGLMEHGEPFHEPTTSIE